MIIETSYFFAGQSTATTAGDAESKKEEQQVDVADAELVREFADAAPQNGIDKLENEENGDGCNFYECQ